MGSNRQSTFTQALNVCKKIHCHIMHLRNFLQSITEYNINRLWSPPKSATEYFSSKNRKQGAIFTPAVSYYPFRFT